MPSKTRSLPSKYFSLTAVALLLAISLLILKSPNKSQQPPPSQPKETIGEKQAIQLVANLQEVQNYRKVVPGAQISLDHFEPETNSYIIQVFETKGGHTNTFNWYEINKDSGQIKPLFP